MRRLFKTALIVLGVLILAAAVFLVPTIWFTPWSIDHFYARTFLTFALKHPMMLSRIRVLEPMGLEFHNDDLDDFSVEFARKEARWLDRQLQILRSYDRDSMDEDHRLSTDILEWFMADAQEGNRFMFHNYPVNQLFGIQSSLPDFMIHTHQINDLGDAEDFVTRVSKFGIAFDQVLEGLRRREEMGIVPPRFVIQKVLEEMTGFAGTPADQNPMFLHFEERLAEIAGPDSPETRPLKERLRAEIEATVTPAYGRLIEYFTALEQAATTDDGVWKFPDGAAFYAYTLRSYTTTDMTAEEIHQMGLEQVARIGGEIRLILKRQGKMTGSLRKSIQKLGEDRRFRFPDSDEGREAILTTYESIIDDVEAKLDDVFDVRPRADVEVRRVPEFKEETSTVAYYQDPAMDGSRPGTFFVNLRDVDEHLRYGMRTLAYHEAIPGHHFQLSLALEMEGVPFFRRLIPFTAYIEGWALYAETLAAERGFLADPFDRLGYLIAQQLRAVRLVVDTGIHAKRWTREQAIAYMLENTGMPETEVVTEIERYIVSPGQACAYMVGQLKILELRERAMGRLGSEFDLREFHNVVLGSGAVPLSILERLVDRWIESKAA
jgi:uncharacterized protein (DUF885 family)